jgi:hypothetical protein
MSLTAQDMIAALDEGLAQAGETIRIQRLATPPASGISAVVICLAVIRGYAPAELIPGSGIAQTDQKMIFSPTPITAAAWPAVGLSPIPRRGDRVISNRGPLTVQAAAGIYAGDTLVRIEAQVRGL